MKGVVPIGHIQHTSLARTVSNCTLHRILEPQSPFGTGILMLWGVFLDTIVEESKWTRSFEFEDIGKY